MPIPGFIQVHTYKMEVDPDTKKKVHQKRLLKTSHIVAVEEHFYTDRNLDLKAVRATAIKMFGQEPFGIKETVDEVVDLIEASQDE